MLQKQLLAYTEILESVPREKPWTATLQLWDSKQHGWSPAGSFARSSDQEHVRAPQILFIKRNSAGDIKLGEVIES